MIYDVTLPLSPELAVWPGDPGIEREDRGDAVKVSRWALGSHAGTHVDSPVHFSAGPKTVDELDPAVLLGPCRVVDVGDVPLITAQTLAGHDLAGVERLLFRTRNSRHWQEAPAQFDTAFVGVDAGAARALLQLGVKLVGVDGLSIEPYGNGGEVHRLFLGAEVILLEGLNLATVPPGDYQLICAPLRLLRGDGAPARVFLVGA